MKTQSLKQIISILALSTLIITSALQVNAQTNFTAQIVDVKVSGTSTLHDWDEKATKASGELTLTLGANDKVTGLTALNFTLPAKSLKSEHSMMDNNTYKALKTDKYANITFVLTSATITSSDATTYQLKCTGKLTIAGTTKETDLIATGKWNPSDRSFMASGSKKFKMTDYGVTPPTVMFGSIKTGNDLTISFNIKYVK